MTNRRFRGVSLLVEARAEMNEDAYVRCSANLISNLHVTVVHKGYLPGINSQVSGHPGLLGSFSDHLVVLGVRCM